ncbi:Snapalysin [Micromonospora saelicesensis]|uniref:Extracellular small neutral protease n=1 Tax=Micromonospora saelicesensis TaxID=285676 RepID=A0A1C4ZT28_9ACTN|nr:snapalysin family zinc-dependent metalloprotease [Micromonospora saelicesensis]RAO05273.1 Snapalysin [Micromonospora saelicesensis]RAO44799.1 Snapalysin [Micromonospora saelicesensis]RAO45023.1 Snapalysin [Micromonospora saelicesensis]RAO55212.1 Snapalysin [Micromonospora saelicesensis]SCF36059.1 snapalysin [Micromonospora saelicesensis]
MFRGQLRRAALAMLVAILAAAGMQLATGTPAAAVRTVYYDASRTGEFRTNFDQAAQIWNSRVSNVRLLAGTPASITIYVDDGWPRAQPTGLGSGRIWMGRTAVNQGYDRTRIATHEVGHILGLPDRRTGLCSDLMSGSSAPVSCRNANPSAAEASRVNSLFAGTLAAPASTTYTWNGASDISPLVVGGRPATENYPFMVYVSGCTGTLIKGNWAVTAKHCSTPSSVRVGSINRSSGGTVVRVTRAVNHPSVDVKLLQLASSVTYAPAPIPSTSGAVGTATRIIGWGQTCAPRGCGSAPAVANELDTSIVADSRCSGINGPYEICTNNTNGNSGACYGDSGGPQVRRVSGVWNLIGATSRAGNNNSTCATGPSIYVDLPSIRSWISTQVGGLPV